MTGEQPSTPPLTEWVLLSYRMPREPSTPRIAVWRKLRRYGVFQLADGVVVLPLSARTREQLEWVAEEVVEAGGSAEVWTASPTTVAQQDRMRVKLSADRAAEYTEIIAGAAEAPREDDAAARRKKLTQLRRSMREVDKRTFFPVTARDEATAALAELAGADEQVMRVQS